MKKKSNQKTAKIAKRLAARAAAVEQPTSTDGAVGNDGTGGAVGEEGGPGVGWSAAETQEVGQVRVVVGGSVPGLNSELLRSILPSTYSSQTNLLMSPMPPPRLLEQPFRSPQPRP